MTKGRKQSADAAKVSNPYTPMRSAIGAPITANTDSAWMNIIKTSPTAADGIFITYVSCKNEGAYVAPMKKHVKDNPLVAASEWNIQGVFDRVENQIPLTVSPKRTYAWDCFATVGSEADTPDAIGAHITREFNKYAKENPNEFKFPQKYRFRSGDNASKRFPVNHFISNEDALAVMKTDLSEKNEHKDIAACNATVKAYFGEDEDGLSSFYALSEDEWKE